MRRRILIATVAALLASAAGPTLASAQPLWWVAVGGQAAVETGRLADEAGTEGGGLVGGGVYLARLGPVRLGPEAEASGGALHADLGPVSDEVTVWRGRLGVRAVWWPPGSESRLLPYLRVGAVYRADRGDLIEDDGFGWYVGGGLDVRVAPRWAVGPFLTYERVGLSIESHTLLLGLRLTFWP
ncbi:MAG TPA: outer membrane beta-barrel protein [Methylomirabilota bacterium]|jgi:opacity protein-like surface antigen|nr:outer membrane beta-barrel protein [Methylomirabilota bacterium]